MLTNHPPPYRLTQSIRPAVLVIRMGSLVLVKYDHHPLNHYTLLWVLRIMRIPVMVGIPGHDRHIEGISKINLFYLKMPVKVLTMHYKMI